MAAGPVSAVTLTVETGEGSTVLATLLLATTQNKSTQPSARAAPLRLFSMLHHIILLLSYSRGRIYEGNILIPITFYILVQETIKAALPSLIRNLVFLVVSCKSVPGKSLSYCIANPSVVSPATELRRWSHYRHGHPAPAPWSPGPAYKLMSDVRSKCPYCALAFFNAYIDTV